MLFFCLSFFLFVLVFDEIVICEKFKRRPRNEMKLKEKDKSIRFILYRQIVTTFRHVLIIDTYECELTTEYISLFL